MGGTPPDQAMLELEQAFSAAVAARARGWLRLWNVEGVGSEVRVRFSRRMFRSVGRCYPARRLVTLADAVREMAEARVLDVLCHELAHLAAYEHFGPRIRPHGPEWRQLVRTAGFEPSVRFSDAETINLLNARARRRPHYLHVCRVCAASRRAARRMPRWRCGACYEIGYDGVLDIIRVEPPR